MSANSIGEVQANF